MNDVEIVLENRPGALAAVGEALGGAGISVEGGGGFVAGGRGVVHALVVDGEAARAALAAAGIGRVTVRDVVTVRLRQSEPGQLGKIARAMADAGVSIELFYSDHEHRLILGVDDAVRAASICDSWSSGVLREDA